MTNIVEDFKRGGIWVRSFHTGGKQIYTRAGKLFDAMMSRCRKGGSTQKMSPKYEGTEVSENFKDFQFFANWCQYQIGYGVEGYALEKDLLGNKLYSEHTCVFVPQALNNIILKSNAIRGDCPIGVNYDKREKRYRADCRIGYGRKSKFLGYYETPELAFFAYKTFKESLIKDRVQEYKGKIDPRAYEALMAYEIKITD